MGYIKNILLDIIFGTLILVPLFLFVHITHSEYCIFYFCFPLSDYSPIPSIYYFYSIHSYGLFYLLLNFYIVGFIARFLSKYLNPKI